MTETASPKKKNTSAQSSILHPEVEPKFDLALEAAVYAGSQIDKVADFYRGREGYDLQDSFDEITHVRTLMISKVDEGQTKPLRQYQSKTNQDGRSILMNMTDWSIQNTYNYNQDHRYFAITTGNTHDRMQITLDFRHDNREIQITENVREGFTVLQNDLIEFGDRRLVLPGLETSLTQFSYAPVQMLLDAASPAKLLNMPFIITERVSTSSHSAIANLSGRTVTIEGIINRVIFPAEMLKEETYKAQSSLTLLEAGYTFDQI